MNKEDYPHICNRCGASAYITGCNDIECSNSSCQKYDGKGGIEIIETKDNKCFTTDRNDWIDISIPKHYAFPQKTPDKDPVGNPHYQHPNTTVDDDTKDLDDILDELKDKDDAFSKIMYYNMIKNYCNFTVTCDNEGNITWHKI